MADIFQLGIALDTSEVKAGINDLSNLERAASTTEAATVDMSAEFKNASKALAALRSNTAAGTFGPVVDQSGLNDLLSAEQDRSASLSEQIQLAQRLGSVDETRFQAALEDQRRINVLTSQGVVNAQDLVASQRNAANALSRLRQASQAQLAVEQKRAALSKSEQSKFANLRQELAIRRQLKGQSEASINAEISDRRQILDLQAAGIRNARDMCSCLQT